MDLYTYSILLLLLTHFIADFLMQSDEMVINKSKSWLILFAHSLVYSVCFFWVFSLMFILITFGTHFLIDAVTSRINSRLHQSHRHWFFAMIGFDQLLHTSILITTFKLLL